MKKVLSFIVKKVVLDNIINIKDFDKVISPLINNKDSFYAYFYASFDKNGKSWCSECTKAKPIIEEVAEQSLSRNNNFLLYNFPIEDKEEYNSNDYFYRISEIIKLEKVPSLIYFKKGKESKRLVGDQLLDKYSVMEFFKIRKELKSKF